MLTPVSVRNVSSSHLLLLAPSRLVVAAAVGPGRVAAAALAAAHDGHRALGAAGGAAGAGAAPAPATVSARRQGGLCKDAQVREHNSSGKLDWNGTEESSYFVLL